MYHRILQGISSLGYGLETNGESLIHIPMSYGTIAMAAAIHGDVQTARHAADWLCLNSTSSCKMGWGLNWAWDAFSNGVTNPPDSLYGVTVAICVDGLLRTYELTGEKRYLAIGAQALEDYACQHSTQDDGIYFHYSDQSADQGYRVANITAMLMAQYAAVGSAIDSDRFIDFCHRAYRGLMSEAIHVGHSMHWLYSSNSRKPRHNDLIHACFIVYGLHRYFQAIGYNAEDRHILAQAIQYVKSFVKEGIVCEVHCTEKEACETSRARSWAVGMLLFLCKQLGENDLAYQVQTVIGEYEFAPGKFSYRFGNRLHSPRSVAFLLLGVA